MVRLECQEGCEFKTLKLPFDKALQTLQIHMERKHNATRTHKRSHSAPVSINFQQDNFERLSLPPTRRSQPDRNNLSSGETGASPSRSRFSFTALILNITLIIK